MIRLLCVGLLFLVCSVANAQKVAKPNAMFDNDGIVNWEFFVDQLLVARSMELTTDQKDRIRELRESNNETYSHKAFAAMRNNAMSKVERTETMARTFRDTSKEFVRRLSRILLPPQKNELQNAAIGQIFSRALMSKLVKNSLQSENFSADKVQSAFGKARKIERELESKISQMRKRAWQEIVGAVESDQINALSDGMQIGNGSTTGTKR